MISVATVRQVINEAAALTKRVSVSGVNLMTSNDNLTASAATLGAVAAGVALFEVALIPGVLIGGAAVLAPNYLRKSRQKFADIFSDRSDVSSTSSAMTGEDYSPSRELSFPAGLKVKRSLAKTITFRVVSSSLDFSWNYILLGEVATAAGLSGIGLLASTVFYFVHETTWNKIRALAKQNTVETGINGSTSGYVSKSDANKQWWSLSVNPAVAKTITFRTMATIAEFTTNYAVVRDIPLAGALSAFGLFAGPFVYYGHEKIWDYYSPVEKPPQRQPKLIAQDKTLLLETTL
jgi:uncharacterized membrane protein